MINETTISVPKIYAYNLGDGSQPLSSFVILEYIEGEVFSSARLKTLSDEQRKRLYTSLADIYIQLRRLEFSSIGCLAHGPEGFNVRKRIATIDINMQELEGLQPSKIQSSFYNDRGSLTSANDYVAMLLQIADNAFVEGRNSVSERDQGEDALYHLHIFREYAKSWMDCRLDQGPFVLVHGDLEPFNLIVNDNMDIVSVLDWEWSRVVPLQFFKPPLWLKNPDTTKLAWNFVYRDYLKSLDQFLEILRTREREKYGNELLSNEWAKAKEDSGFLVANALENWTDIDWFANRYINWKCYKDKGDLDERVKAFMKKDPAHKTLIERKVCERIVYKVEADRLEDTTIKSAPSYTDKPASAYATMKYFFLRHLWKDTICVSPTIAQIVLGGAIIITGTSYLLVKRIQIPLKSG